MKTNRMNEKQTTSGIEVTPDYIRALRFDLTQQDIDTRSIDLISAEEMERRKASATSQLQRDWIAKEDAEHREALERRENRNYISGERSDVFKASKTTQYKTKRGKMKFNHAKPSAFNALVYRVNHDIPCITYNDIKCRPLTKGVRLTPEQQARIFERHIMEAYEGTTVEGLEGITNKAGKPWNHYTIARKAVYGKLTEDMRVERPEVFRLNYADMLQNGIAALYDTERVGKTIARTLKKYPELADEPKQLLLRAYFRTATNGVKNWIDANKATFYRQAVNAAGMLPTKEQAKDMREARSSYYADNKYVPEITDIYEEGDNLVTVLAYHAPVEHYRQRVAIVNQDEHYSASTSWKQGEALAAEYSNLELRTAELMIDLEALLADKPSDLAVAQKLLAGTMDLTTYGKISPRRRERIRDAYRECLGI